MESFKTACLLLTLAPFLVFAGESPITTDGAVSFGPSAQRDNIWADEHPGYAIQTGYEGYLVPAETLSIKDIVKTAGFLAAIPAIGKLALKFALKAALAVVGVLGVLAVGVLLTFGLCTFTPLCHITLHKLDKWHHWDRASVRALISQDSISSAAELLSSAIAKYKDINSKPQQSKQ